MIILHTSDWHLGQKFLYNERGEEHRLALEWLLNCIKEHRVELLLVAGDIFDIGNPPSYARKLYFWFLKELLSTSCRHVVIIGGNHDSPAMINAPKELLAILNVHVVGTATGNLEDEIIALNNEEGQLEAVIAAVPFLRDRDLIYSVSGEGGIDRIDRIQKGILQHYEALAKDMEVYKDKDIPIIATGHLYATGAEASDKQDNIYIGNVENIRAKDFPDIFNYVALGHIHRPQAVGGLEHVRYSGSLIPLSFSEVQDLKSVYLLTFSGSKLMDINAIEISTFRRLKRIQGSLKEVEARLKQFSEKDERLLIPWVEVTVETDVLIPQLDQQLKAFTKEMYLELLKIKVLRTHTTLDEQLDAPDLTALGELDVFRKKCESYGSAPEEIGPLEETFKELKEWLIMEEQEK